MTYLTRPLAVELQSAAARPPLSSISCRPLPYTTKPSSSSSLLYTPHLPSSSLLSPFLFGIDRFSSPLMMWRRLGRFHSLLRVASMASPTRPLLPSMQRARVTVAGEPISRSSCMCLLPVSFTNLKDQSGSKSCCYSSQAWVEPPEQSVVEVPLAQTGEGIAECELLKWFVQEGDQVEEFQALCEVQSDKATIEITSRYKGKVHEIMYVPGDIVKVGETLLKIFLNECQSTTSTSDATAAPNSVTTEENEKAPLVAGGVMGKVLSTPPVRLLAKQYGIDINNIQGTGKDGRVLKEDVLRYYAGEGTGEHLVETSNVVHMQKVDGHGFEDKKIQLRGFQRSMVKSMTMASKVPHFHYVEELNCNSLVELKTSFQRQKSDPDVKHTYLPFLIKSLSMALSKYPMLNSSFIEETNEVLLKGSHNIGVAMATEHGLVVPNIKKVQLLSILEITKELSRLQQLASSNKLQSEDISDGTITISNIGAIGGNFGCPLINLPEAAIIAIGRIQKLPRFDHDGSVYPAAIAKVAMGADHRIVDGATVARFCNEWKQLVENPELMLLHMT